MHLYLKEVNQVKQLIKVCLPFCCALGDSVQKYFLCRGQTAGLNNKRDIKHPTWENWSTGHTLLQRSCCRHESLMRGVSRLTWKHLHTNSRGGEATCISVNSVLRLRSHQIYIFAWMLCLTLLVWLWPLRQTSPSPAGAVKRLCSKYSMVFRIYCLQRRAPSFSARHVRSCQLKLGRLFCYYLPFPKCNIMTEVMSSYVGKESSRQRYCHIISFITLFLFAGILFFAQM